MTNPFKRKTGVLPSYFTGRVNELKELKKYLIQQKKVILVI